MNDLREKLIEWTYDIDAIYLTDDEEGPEGVIASDQIVCSIKKEDNKNLIYFKGDEDYLSLLLHQIKDLDNKIEIVTYE